MASLKRTLDFDPNHGRESKRRCTSYTPTHQELNPSPFGEVCPKLTPEEIAARIHGEIRRFHHSKQFNFHQGHGVHSSQDTSSDGAVISPVLFTFQQVELICERMLKERENLIRKEYDRVLNTKLSEQYDAFVKFANDQIEKRFEAADAPSYLS